MVRICQCFSFADADYRVHISEIPSTADLFVYLVSSQGLAFGNGVWYQTENDLEADYFLQFTDFAQADLSIYFVNNKSSAGWQTPSHKLKGVL